MFLLAHDLGTYGAAAAAMAGWLACLMGLNAAAMPGAGRGRLAAAFVSYVCLSAGYWLPVIRACVAVGAAMLGCPSLLQLPAVLLARPVLPHVLLCLIAIERWVASAATEYTALCKPPLCIDMTLASLVCCQGRMGRWAAAACLHLLYWLQPQVGPSMQARPPCCGKGSTVPAALPGSSCAPISSPCKRTLPPLPAGGAAPAISAAQRSRNFFVDAS